MNQHLEDRLRRHLGDLDHVPVAGPSAVATGVERMRRRRQHRRRAAGGAAMAGVVAVGALGVWASTRPDGDLDEAVLATSPTEMSLPEATTATTGTAVAPTSPVNSWTQVPADPRGPTSEPAVVWTGSEAITVGGLDPDRAPRGGAVAYDPAAAAWRRLSDPPDGWNRVHPLAVWTGELVLLAGGDSSDGSPTLPELLRYDPATDTWEYGLIPPIGLISDRSPWVWTGDELLVWPSTEGFDDVFAPPLAYDPVADTWRDLPAAPVEQRQQAASVWTGSEWVIWGGVVGDRSLGDGAAFDPATGTWRTLAASPLSSRSVRAVWTGSEMLIAAGADGLMALPDGAAYDPVTDRWRSIRSGLAHPGFLPVWTGSQLVLFAKGSAVVYDAVTDRWVDSCCSSGGGGEGGTPIWTGSTVLLLGSFDPAIGGATFTPPPAAP